MFRAPKVVSRRAHSRDLTNVLFLSAERRTTEGSRLYRCAYQAKQLHNAGVAAQVVYYEDASKSALESADVLVFSRCSNNKIARELVQAARTRGQLVCADLDDKIFTPWDVDAKGYLRSKSTSGRDFEARGHEVKAERGVLALLPLMDEIIVSTPSLESELQALGLRTYLSRNAFDLAVCEPSRLQRTALGRILVMAGTKTHDADLRLVAAPLARFLHENPAITCTFLGPLDLPSPLRGLPNIERVSLLPIAELYPFVSKFDLCVVPLENTPFNDCKSALKFVECGVVSVPVLASPRAEYRALVRHRENGFLAADDSHAWYRGLCELRDDPASLGRAATQAQSEVLAAHTVPSRGSLLADHFRTLLGSG